MARRTIKKKIKAKSRPLRRSQLISPFGVGAISDFRGDESLICAGLDEWFSREREAPQHLRLDEPRLQRRLGKQFLIRPPEFDGEDAVKRRIPFVRFPKWHYCPICFRMAQATYFQDQPRCDPCKTGRPRRMIPVRIVATCDDGHLQDFPFRAWINCSCADADAARLFFKAGRSSAGLGGIHISCEACGKSKSLAGALHDDAISRVGVPCAGSRPWFAEEATTCRLNLKGVQRGGSNVYFPVVVSSIFVPDEESGRDDKILALLERENIWSVLTAVLENGEIDKARSDLVSTTAGVDPERFFVCAQAKLKGNSGEDAQPISEEEFRQQEYALLRRSSGADAKSLVVDWRGGADYGSIGRYLTGVGLVRKLRETRALFGFTRLEPETDLLSPRIQPLAHSDEINWLPAVDVYGEGIFIEFKYEALKAWASQKLVTQRLSSSLERFERVRRVRGQDAHGAHARFVFLHTFAHAMIKELTFSCGYGSSSLRERLYVDIRNPETPMAGVLIYTASGDSDGTLGGLVAQGEPDRLPRIVSDAMRRAAWCSNDPVCMEISTRAGDIGNLAACHSCVLVPETSCEQGNKLLDRATLIGTIGGGSVGFLASLLPEQGSD